MPLLEELLAGHVVSSNYPGLDQMQRHIYGLLFENAFLKARGKEFETLFARTMENRFPSAFQTVRPYGSRGDLKCDGFLTTQGVVFQCYAPLTLHLRNLLDKLDTDLRGAVVHWGQRMRYWVFVHNQHDGLPADAVRALQDLAAEFPELSIETWSLPALREVTLSLSRF